MPMGSRIQMDPTVNLDSLAFLRPADKIICKALQVYGAYTSESTNSGSGATSLYFQQYNIGDGASPLGNISPFPSSPMSKEVFRYCRIVAPPPTPLYDTRTSIVGTGEPHH